MKYIKDNNEYSFAFKLLGNVTLIFLFQDFVRKKFKCLSKTPKSLKKLKFFENVIWQLFKIVFLLSNNTFISEIKG